MKIAPAVVARFRPAGRLRAAINLGDPILVNADATTAAGCGESVELAHQGIHGARTAPHGGAAS